MLERNSLPKISEDDVLSYQHKKRNPTKVGFVGISIVKFIFYI